MPEFHIPGLGSAKPNEILPPLPVEAQCRFVPASARAAVDVAEEEDHDMHNAGDTAPTVQIPAPNATVDHTATTFLYTIHDAIPVADSDPADSMAVDRPASPPSLTHALEAAIGGLQDVNREDVQPGLLDVTTAQDGQGGEAEFEMDSSPYESSSESSSDSSDDSDDYEPLGIEETARLLLEAEGGSDDEGYKGAKGSSASQLRTKNEVVESAVPMPDVTITPDMKIEELGMIESKVEDTVLIMAFTPGEYQVLDSGSVLCTSQRAVIGAVAETIGKVQQPMYTVRFSSADEIKELGLEIGTKIYYSIDHASYIFTEPLKKIKGSDASNLHDEEVGVEEMEFSDDEKEADYKRSLKQKKKDKWKNGPNARGGKEPHPLRQESRPDGGLNYDDDEDGPYKLLTRPAGLASGPMSTSTDSYSPTLSNSGHQRRGRGGDSRGRAGRGRGAGRGGRGGYSQPRDGFAQAPQAQQQYHQPAPAVWAGSPVQPPPGHAMPPAMPNFGFQFAGWPQPPSLGHAGAPAPPPPPPGWPAQQGQAAPNPAFMDPAFLAALVSQMQQQQQSQNGQGQNGG